MQICPHNERNSQKNGNASKNIFAEQRKAVLAHKKRTNAAKTSLQKKTAIEKGHGLFAT